MQWTPENKDALTVHESLLHYVINTAPASALGGFVEVRAVHILDHTHALFLASGLHDRGPCLHDGMEIWVTRRSSLTDK